MTTIYLIRHAEAEGNLYGRPQGQYDANITMLGRRQTAALAERFRDVPIDGLWSSDLVRAQSTASAILKYHPQLTMHLDRDLREVDVGCWEDRTWAEIRREFPEQHHRFDHDPEKWHVPGSEPYEAVVRRMKGALLRLGAAYPGKTLAVVSHAFAIRAVAADLSGVPFGQMPFGDNTAVTTLAAEDGGLRLLAYGDGSHLGQLSTRVHLGLADGRPGRKADGLLTPMALPAEQALYARCYGETWVASHGSRKGFAPAPYLYEASRRVKEDPRCLEKILCDGQMAGLIELDPERGAGQNAGWISLLWVEPEMRGRRLGAQLIGHAVGYFRGKDRTAIRLHVSQTNAAAIGFYQAMGFRVLDTAQGVGGPQYLMEMDIRRKVWVLP